MSCEHLNSSRESLKIASCAAVMGPKYSLAPEISSHSQVAYIPKVFEGIRLLKAVGDSHWKATKRSLDVEQGEGKTGNLHRARTTKQDEPHHDRQADGRTNETTQESPNQQGEHDQHPKTPSQRAGAKEQQRAGGNMGCDRANESQLQRRSEMMWHENSRRSTSVGYTNVPVHVFAILRPPHPLP